jgi:hypothetical protein
VVMMGEHTHTHIFILFYFVFILFLFCFYFLKYIFSKSAIATTPNKLFVENKNS